MLSDILTVTFLAGWLAGAVRLAGTLMIAAFGEIFCERSGVLNVGVEGTMLLGALAGYLLDWATGMPWLGLFGGILAGLAAGLLLALMYVTLQASQVVVGIIFNILALGLAGYLYRLALGGMAGVQTAPLFRAVPIPGLSEIPLLGPALFHHTVPLYLAVLAAPVAAYVLYRTPFGLNLRAVGENPHAAETAGLSVAAYRYAGVLISSAAAGLAGAYLVTTQVGQFRDTLISGQGFIALAIVIFGRWDPWRAVLAALVFGAADALQLSLQMFDIGVPSQLLLALPYLLTVAAMSGVFRKAYQPEAFMQRYAKE